MLDLLTMNVIYQKLTHNPSHGTVKSAAIQYLLENYLLWNHEKNQHKLSPVDREGSGWGIINKIALQTEKKALYKNSRQRTRLLKTEDK